MSLVAADPPRPGEGDRAQRGGGGSAPQQRPTIYQARRLRGEMSLPEVLLWQRLRQRPLGIKFRRQHAIEPYVVDFFCHSARLIVEIDGRAHDTLERAKHDEARDEQLRQRGFAVVRVPATDVLDDADRVAAYVCALAQNPLHHAPHGPPPRHGED